MEDLLEPTRVEVRMSYLKNYFKKVAETKRTSSAIAYLAALDAVAEASPGIAKSIVKELQDQRSYLKLIASENFSSLPVQLVMGNLLTDKYSEGYVGHRFYAGCENVDQIEGEANELAKKLLHWEPKYTLEEGLKICVSEFKENEGLIY